MTPRTFTFVKNVKGSLYIDLETFDMMGATKTFVFGPTIDKLIIPYPYALGLFVSPSALDMYRNGIFTIENDAELYKAGVEQGFVAREERPDVTRLVDIEAAIKGNKVRALKDIIAKGENDPVVVNNVVYCAREFFDSLSNEMVELIQTATGVDLRVE
jgi:hypothetical protein